jgi:hypothetical protein
MSINLPPVIEMVRELKEELNRDVLVLNPKDTGVLPDESKAKKEKRFVICISRDISEADCNMLKEYGKVIIFNNVLYNNLDPLSYNWDYLVLDHRQKADRYYHLKHIKPIESQLNVVLFCHGIEIQDLKNDNHYDNVISKFPERQARSDDFNQLLLIERLPAPKWWWSLAKCLFKNYANVQ